MLLSLSFHETLDILLISFFVPQTFQGSSLSQLCVPHTGFVAKSTISDFLSKPSAFPHQAYVPVVQASVLSLAYLSSVPLLSVLPTSILLFVPFLSFLALSLVLLSVASVSPPLPCVSCLVLVTSAGAVL